MNYNSQNQNGDAAEYFTAYKFTSLFRWPFRLYGVDLGIDGELEVQDNDNASTGNLIKVQVKSITGQSSQARQVYVYPTDAQVEYWKTFCTPVIMCAVDLDAEEIYWTQINETNAYVSPNGRARVTFDRVDNLLTAASATTLQELITPPEAHRLRAILGSMKKTFSEVADEHGNLAVPIGLEAGGRFQDVAIALAKQIDDAEVLAKHYPWKFSLSDRALLAQARKVSAAIRQRGDEAISGHFS